VLNSRSTRATPLTLNTGLTMTWVFGWPLYNDDALNIAKTRNLVKDPNAGDDQRIQAARLWVADQIGIVPVLSCWVKDFPEIVYAVYVEYGDNRYPPPDLIRENMTMTDKHYRRLKKVMPLKDLGWYQYNDPSCELYKEEEEEGSDDGSDTDSDGDSDNVEGDDDDAPMSTVADDEDTAGSDDETVTDDAVPKLDLLPEVPAPLRRPNRCRRTSMPVAPSPSRSLNTTQFTPPGVLPSYCTKICIVNLLRPVSFRHGH